MVEMGRPGPLSNRGVLEALSSVRIAIYAAAAVIAMALLIS